MYQQELVRQGTKPPRNRLLMALLLLAAALASRGALSPPSLARWVARPPSRVPRVLLPPCMSSSASPLKARLLAAAAASGRGFETSEAQKAEVLRLIRELVASSPPPPDRADVDGDWELLWTDAPDILGLRVGQQIDTRAGTIENVIEYEPARWNPLVAPLGAQDDRVQQRVLLTFVASGQRYDLRLAGTAFRFETLLGVKLGALRRLELKGPFDVPFGSFDLLYNDGSLRIVRTLQGFYSLNRKMGPEEGWDAAS